jgi:hypothetical protein
MRGFPRGFLGRCGGAAEGTGAERHASVRPGCIRELAPEKELLVIVAVFLANCYNTEWVLASERRGGRELAVASTACLHCCTLPSPPPPYVSVSRVCLLLEHQPPSRYEWRPGVAGRGEGKNMLAGARGG